MRGSRNGFWLPADARLHAQSLKGESEGGEVRPSRIHDNDFSSQRNLLQFTRIEDLKHALGAWEFVALTADRLPERTPHALETGLNHVMRVLARDPNVQRRPKAICQRAKKVRDELGRELPYPFPVESPRELNERTPRKIERHRRFRLVHRQQESISFNAALVPERLAKRFA